MQSPTQDSELGLVLSSRNNLKNEVKTINATKAFKFFEVDVAVNDSEFALAA